MCKIYSKPVVDMISTGRNIKTLRVENGYTVRDIQTIFNFEHPQAIYNWEAGKSLPTVDNLIVLADLFCVRVDEIVKTQRVPIEVGETILKSA